MYPGSDVLRLHVPDNKRAWNLKFEEYYPPNYTSSPVLDQPVWADLPVEKMKRFPKYNELDGKINRKSHQGKYEVLKGLPLNPNGRSGICGRGLLGRWGPNHAADPIVTRWLRDESNKIVYDETTNSPVLQFVAIQRSDSGDWAIPGGMVDAGEMVSATLKREFGEEALNSLEMEEREKSKLQHTINQLFNQGTLVYKGVVDDPRNTDNAWMETCAYNFHDVTGESVGKLQLQSGDDASSVKWMSISSNIKLYANHSTFIRKVALLRKAHW